MSVNADLKRGRVHEQAFGPDAAELERLPTPYKKLKRDDVTTNIARQSLTNFQQSNQGPAVQLLRAPMERGITPSLTPMKKAVENKKPKGDPGVQLLSSPYLNGKARLVLTRLHFSKEESRENAETARAASLKRKSQTNNVSEMQFLQTSIGRGMQILCSPLDEQPIIKDGSTVQFLKTPEGRGRLVISRFFYPHKTVYKEAGTHLTTGQSQEINSCFAQAGRIDRPNQNPGFQKMLGDTQNLQFGDLLTRVKNIYSGLNFYGREKVKNIVRQNFVGSGLTASQVRISEAICKIDAARRNSSTA